MYMYSVFYQLYLHLLVLDECATAKAAILAATDSMASALNLA